MDKKAALEQKQIDDQCDLINALIRDSPAAAEVFREAVRHGGVNALLLPAVASIAAHAKLQEMLAAEKKGGRDGK